MRRTSFLLVLLVGFTAPTALAAELAALDVAHYRIVLEIPDSGDEIRATATIVADVPASHAPNVSLDLVGMTVDSVRVGSRPAKFHRDGASLVIALEKSMLGTRVSIEVSYHGHPTDGLFLLRNKFGDRTVFADNWPNRARGWIPSHDDPSDKATVEFDVTAPAGLDVVANGTLVERTHVAAGRVRTRFNEAVPIPTYCMVVGAAAFAVVRPESTGCIPVAFYAYPADRDNAVRGYGRATEMLEFYSRLVAPYPYEKLDLVQSTTRFGGMENAGAIFFDEKSYGALDAGEKSNRLEDTVAHEIAHQWFGDSVTERDWHDLWLSEGFATYFGHLFFERADGRDRMHVLMRADRERVFAEDAKGARPIRDPAITDLFKLLNVYTYQKGGWVLHMLRHTMGDEAFFAGIRDYYRAHRDGNASTDDLRLALEARAGRPLDWFFQQWVNGAGHPKIEADWQWDASAKVVRVRVTQTQAGEPYRLRLDVETVSGGRTARVAREVSLRDQEIVVPCVERPDAVVLDPDEWVLAEIALRAR